MYPVLRAAPLVPCPPARLPDLPVIRLDVVCRTYVTARLANATGWHEVKVNSQRLGHALIGITLDKYSHVLPAADEQARTRWRGSSSVR